MKKILSTLALGAAITTVASADIMRLEMGGGVWQQSPSGTVTYTDTTTSAYGTYTSSKKDYNGAYVWMLLKHPLPIIPNLRLEYTKIKDEGTAKGSFEDFSTTSTTARFDMKQYDIIPYYNLLDNTFWATLDVGIDIKVLDTTFEADSVQIDGVGALTKYTDSKTVAIPMAYGRARVEIPATGFGLEADAKYITYDGSTVYDVRAKIDYTFDISPVIQPGIEVGYRAQKFDIKTDDDKTKMNMDFTGFYAGLMLRF